MLKVNQAFLFDMLFRYRDLPLGIKMPDSLDGLPKNQISPSSSSNGMSGMNSAHSPIPPGTPSPPMSNVISNPPPLDTHHQDMPNGSSRSKPVLNVKRFLATLQQYASKMSADTGERVHSLIIGLVSASVSIEDFQHKIQEIMNYPFRPFAIPFLRSHLPLLQTELIHFSRAAKQSPQQYLRQHEHAILDSNAGAEPFDIFQGGEVKEPAKRKSPNSRHNKMEQDYMESNGDSQPPSKRHQPYSSPNVGPRTSPAVPVLGLPPSLNYRYDEAPIYHCRDREGRFEGYERLEREMYRPFYGNLSRDYPEDREMDEEWRNIHTMLNCILGMVEKTKRALCILQHRSYAERAELSGWVRGGRNHLEPDLEPKKLSRPSGIAPHLKGGDERVCDVRRRTEEAVSELKRQAAVELQKAAENKAGELVAAERLKMERLLVEARRQAAEDALLAASHQEESTENCWNCGRKANETCSGCNVARYCGSFCQHKDWETHHIICGQTAAKHTTPSSSTSSTSPRTASDSPSRTSNLPDVKPVKVDNI